jgi:iron(III) transport system permease protein
VSALVTAITMPLAFGLCLCADAQCMRFKPLFRGITLVPLLAPSLLSAISLIYWFGNQGVLKALAQALASTRSTARRASWWPNALRCFRMR